MGRCIVQRTFDAKISVTEGVRKSLSRMRAKRGVGGQWDVGLE